LTGEDAEAAQARAKYISDHAQDALQRSDRELKTIQSLVDPLCKRASNFTYVIPIAAFTKMDKFPKHEDAAAAGVIQKLRISALSNGDLDVLLVSHKWLGNSPDTVENEFCAGLRRGSR